MWSLESSRPFASQNARCIVELPSQRRGISVADDSEDVMADVFGNSGERVLLLLQGTRIKTGGAAEAHRPGALGSCAQSRHVVKLNVFRLTKELPM